MIRGLVEAPTVASHRHWASWWHGMLRLSRSLCTCSQQRSNGRHDQVLALSPALLIAAAVSLNNHLYPPNRIETSRSTFCRRELATAIDYYYPRRTPSQRSCTLPNLHHGCQTQGPARRKLYHLPFVLQLHRTVSQEPFAPLRDDHIVQAILATQLY